MSATRGAAEARERNFAGEWGYTPLEVKTPNVPLRWLVTSEDHWPIAETYSEQDAAQIVRDHAAVPKLVEALKAAKDQISSGYQPPELMDQIDAALASTQEKQ